MTLVDTSVWIDFFRGQDSAPVQRLEALIQRGENLALCGVILTEVLQGIRDERAFERTRNLLKTLLLLPMTELVFVQAAVIYRTLRVRGTTIRKPVDCMIAATALEHDVWLLHKDRDFDHIARHFPLRISLLEH